MIIGGLQKTTLIDFPGRVACTVFTIGCNFRCPFCHNKDLVTLDNFKKSGLENISEQLFFEFLDKRKKILDGVCITGGEPTLQLDLTEFCQKIKRLGLEVKLDTNGSNPKVVGDLIKEKLVDFIAMDVKTTFSDYKKVVNVKCPASGSDRSTRLIQSCSASDPTVDKQNLKLINNIKKSILIILRSDLEYEFRTTIVPGLHNKASMIDLAKDLKNITQSINYQSVAFNYFLQPFRPQNCLDASFLNIKPYSDQEMLNLLKSVQKILPNTKLRGAD